MGVNKQTARTAGVLYLIVVVTGILSLAYIPSQTIVRGDAAAAVSNVVQLESLFRLGIVAGLGSALFPGYSQTIISDFVGKPALFEEVGTCLWL